MSEAWTNTGRKRRWYPHFDPNTGEYLQPKKAVTKTEEPSPTQAGIMPGAFAQWLPLAALVGVAVLVLNSRKAA